MTHDSLALLDDDEQEETSKNDKITSPEANQRSQTDDAKAGSVTASVSDATITIGPLRKIRSFVIPGSPNSLSSVTADSTSAEVHPTGMGTRSRSHNNTGQEDNDDDDDSIILVTQGHHMKKLPVSNRKQIRYRCNWCYHFNWHLKNARSLY